MHPKWTQRTRPSASQKLPKYLKIDTTPDANLNPPGTLDTSARHEGLVEMVGWDPGKLKM